MKTKVILVAIAFLVVLIISNAKINCQIESSSTCSAGTALLRMKSDTGGYDNAHAQQVNYTTPYSNTLCCNSTNNPALGNSSGTTFLNLSADTDAHVQAPNETTATYAPAAFISGSTSNPTCNVYIEGCPSGYDCLVSIANNNTDNTTNAHVSSCNYYVSEVCCSMNSPPNNVSDDYFLDPFHGNATLFNRTITFQWLNTTDPDGDTLTYNIQVKQCGTSDPSTCNPDVEFDGTFTQPGEFEASSISEGTNITEYISMEEVAADQNYTWRARAHDGTEYSEWSENWTFYSPSSVILSLFDENMSFGSMKPDEVNDTTNEDPYPFRVRNDGNVLTDINITVNTSTDWLWVTSQTASEYFQYWIDNATAYTTPDNTFGEENGSFNWSASATTPNWFNMPLTNASANIRQLNYSDITDEAEIDVKITVPSDEPAGNKGSMITIAGWVAV